MKWFGITLLALMLVVGQQSDAVCQVSPSLVFQRVYSSETDLLGEARATASYYIAPPEEEPVSDDDDTGLYADNDAWEAGSIAGILLASSAYGETVDLFAEYSNLTGTTSPDGQIIADVTGIHTLNFWNEASEFASTEVGAYTYSQSESWWKIVDPDPEDAFEPPESVTVTGSIEATWGFSGAGSGDYQATFINEASWQIYAGGISPIKTVTILREGVVYVDEEVWGTIDWDSDSVSIPFEFEGHEDDEITIVHTVYGSASVVCSDASVMGGGSIVWGIFTTLPEPGP